MAGLSLAAVTPGLALTKIAKGSMAAKEAAAGAQVGKAAATRWDDVVAAAKSWRPMKPWQDCDLVPRGGLRLRYGTEWTRKQRKAADEKVKALYEAAQKGALKKSKTAPSRESASSTFTKGTGKPVPDGYDVDHTHDRQLGGNDDISNLKLLDKTVNRSLGKQVELQIRSLEFGAPIPGACIR